MTSVLRIGARDVGPHRPTYVIAEAGVNHDGEPARAHALVDAAADAGADAVKFQTFRATDLATARAARAQYQSGPLGADPSQLSMLTELELPPEIWPALQRHARDRRIEFLSTPFDLASLDLLIELGVPAIKIGSGDLTNTHLLRRAASSGRPVLCSTGMGTLGEIAEAVGLVRACGGEVALLHCVSSYPAPDDQANLRAISTLRTMFGVPVGYSDHTLGRLACLAAVALDAVLVEKHLTLDRGAPGPDHRASLEPAEMRALVAEVRSVEALVGTGAKVVQPGELETKRVARRSLVYARDLSGGTVLVEEHVALKRPETGLPPSLEGVVVGRRLTRDVAADDLIELADLE